MSEEQDRNCIRGGCPPSTCDRWTHPIGGEAPEFCVGAKQDDPINPAHYQGTKVMEVIEDFDLGFRLGNTVKYILRAGKKGNRLEDLKKARWYLDREIERSA